MGRLNNSLDHKPKLIPHSPRTIPFKASKSEFSNPNKTIDIKSTKTRIYLIIIRGKILLNFVLWSLANQTSSTMSNRRQDWAFPRSVSPTITALLNRRFSKSRCINSLGLGLALSLAMAIMSLKIQKLKLTSFGTRSLFKITFKAKTRKKKRRKRRFQQSKWQQLWQKRFLIIVDRALLFRSKMRKNLTELNLALNIRTTFCLTSYKKMTVILTDLIHRLFF